MLDYDIKRNGELITKSTPEKRKVNLFYFKLSAMEVKETSDLPDHLAHFQNSLPFQVGDIFEVTISDVVSEEETQGRQDSRSEGKQCSFCTKGQREVEKLIAGPGVFICNECVELCTDILQEESKPRDATGPNS
jgi:hypothetical protein